MTQEKRGYSNVQRIRPQAANFPLQRPLSERSLNKQSRRSERSRGALERTSSHTGYGTSKSRF
jgi:hypothetical protein